MIWRLLSNQRTSLRFQDLLPVEMGPVKLGPNLVMIGFSQLDFWICGCLTLTVRISPTTFWTDRRFPWAAFLTHPRLRTKRTLHFCHLSIQTWFHPNSRQSPVSATSGQTDIAQNQFTANMRTNSPFANQILLIFSALWNHEIKLINRTWEDTKLTQMQESALMCTSHSVTPSGVCHVLHRSDDKSSQTDTLFLLFFFGYLPDN